ncbi:hypothetical protein F5B20DRAFT_555124 [Whalleya microplaca]|nr:hypothetical protein F5B20DRAFT_555124 [Whalleya microplaca]
MATRSFFIYSLSAYKDICLLESTRHFSGPIYDFCYYTNLKIAVSRRSTSGQQHYQPRITNLGEHLSPTHHRLHARLPRRTPSSVGTMSDLETFTLLPLQLDPQTKSVTSTSPSRSLQAELAALNVLHRSLHSLETPNQVPPPPLPVNPKRSANITKLRDSGNAEHRRGRHADAIKFYSLGLQMALGRPLWEPQQLVREEVAALYANRAQAHMALQAWPEGAADAEASVEAKRVGNSKAWWRRGKCLMEMGRLTEANEWVGKGLEMEGEEGELMSLMKEINAKLEKEKSSS